MIVSRKTYQKLWEKLSKANRNKEKYRNALCAVFASYVEKINNEEELNSREQVIYDYLVELGFNNALKIIESEGK